MMEIQHFFHLLLGKDMMIVTPVPILILVLGLMQENFAKITAEEAAKYLGMEESELTPETCSKQYKEAWNATNTPDPIDTTMTTLEEEVAQLQEEEEKNLCLVLQQLKKVLLLPMVVMET
jgi:hypothetical protein